MVPSQGALSPVHMSTKGVAVIPEISPGETSASNISGSWMYQDRAAACHVCVGAVARPAGHGLDGGGGIGVDGPDLTVAALPRSARYPCEPEIMR